MGRFFEEYKGKLLFMFVYSCVCLGMLFKSGDFLYAMLVWNVLLAVLPLYFIRKAVVTLGQKKISWSVIWIFLWLFFFPNSVYMITDFIHISNEKFMWVIEVERYSSDAGVVYSRDIMIWAKLLVIGMGFFYTLLVGLESFYTFEQIIRKKFSKVICYLVIIGVALLAGIGVYIGRFLRFNSWDILFDPLQLLKEVARIDGFGIQFIIAFTIFVVGSYALYRTLRMQPKLKM